MRKGNVTTVMSYLFTYTYHHTMNMMIMIV